MKNLHQRHTIWLRVASLLIAGMMGFGGAHAQHSVSAKIPQVVMKACAAKFGRGTDAQWKRCGDSAWAAGFSIKGIRVTATFDSVGRWIETVTNIRRAKILKPIQMVLHRDYKNYTIIETEKIELASSPRPLFEIHLEKGKQILQAVFDEQGSVIRKTEKSRKG